MIVHAVAREILPGGVRIQVEGREETIEAESVAYAVGARPYSPLLDELRGRFDAVYPVGDCVTPQRVRQAVEAGFRAGMTV